LIQKFYSKLSDKEKKKFYFAVGAIVLALFDILFIRPFTSRLKTIDEEIVDKEDGINRDLRFLAYTDHILAEHQSFARYYPKAIQSPDQIKAEFLQQIEKLATEAKVNLTKVNPAGEKEKQGFIQYYAELECNGSLDDVAKFMHLIDTTQDLLKVVKMNITGKSAGSREIAAAMTVVKVIINEQALASMDEVLQKFPQVKKMVLSTAQESSVPTAAVVDDAKKGQSTEEVSAKVTYEAGPGEKGKEENNKTADPQAVEGTKGQGEPSEPTVKAGKMTMGDWWNSLWGKKPKPKPQVPADIPKDINWDEMQPKKNVWERMLKGKKQGNAEDAPVEE